MTSEMHFDLEWLSGGNGFLEVEDGELALADIVLEGPAGLDVPIDGGGGIGVS